MCRKRGRTVPVVLTKLNEKSIAVLIETRSSISVHKDNGDVFAVQTSNSLNHIRGCDALRKYVTSLVMKCPEAITSSNLRRKAGYVSKLSLS